MKKICTLITVCLLAQASFAQNIVSLSAPGLNCAGDQTAITVVTDYTDPIPNLPTGLTYNLLQSNSNTGPFAPWPGQQSMPFTTATFTIPNIQSSHWQVQIMDAGGVVTDQDIISIASIPSFDFVPAFPATVNDIGCNGANDGSIQLWLQGGTWPYDFNWVGPGGYVNNQLNTNPSNLSGLSPGTYTCIAIDENGCSFNGGTIQYTIIDPPALDVSNTSSSLYNGGVNVSCFGASDGTATVTPTGGTVAANYTYSWNDPSNQSTPTAINLTAGTYTCTVTDDNSCVATTANIILTEPAPLSATILLSDYNNVNVSCIGDNDGTADLTGLVTGGSGPYFYDWRDNAGLQIAQTISVAGLSAGNYTVTITDQNNCTFPIAFTMTEPATAVSAVALVTSSYFGAEVSCFGSSDGIATASGVLASGTPYTSGPAYTYLWTPNPQATAIATGLSANIPYTVVVTDANGCFDDASVTLTQPTVVDTISTSSTLTDCNGDYNGTATVTPTGGTAPYGYVWDDISVQTTATAVGLNAGTYNCQLTDVNGCPFNNNPLIDVTVVVSEPDPIILSANLNNVNCFGGSDGDATVSVTGGTPDLAGNYNYLWSTGHTTATASGLSETSISGPYLCTVTDDNGCTASIFIDISEPTSLPTAVTTSTMVSCFGGSDGEVTVVISGGTPTYSYIWRDPSNAIISTSQNPTGLSAGTYECTFMDANGCQDLIDATVLQPSTNLTNSSTIITTVSCNAGSDGGALVNPTGGVPGYTFSWEGPFPSTAVISTVNNIVGQVAGQYLCWIEDAAGCEIPVTVDITEPPVVGFSLVQSTDPSCVGFTDGSATVVPTGGVGFSNPNAYQWNDPLAQTTATASGLVAGTYQCVITDDNGCSPMPNASISVTLTDPSPIIFVVSPHINVMCTGDPTGSLDLVVSGGTQHTLPATPYDYTWSNGPTTSLNSSLVAGTYDCWIEDANGCIINTGPIQITEPAIALGASITSQIDESCYMLADGQLTCTPDLNSGTGTGTYSFLWSHGAAGNTASNLSAGPYYCTVTDANGCSYNTPTVNIIAATQLTVTSTWNPPSCNSTTTTGITNNGTATVTTSGGTGNYFYAWDDVPLFQTTQTASNLITGTYNCLITDGNGCVYPEQVVVPEPTPNITATFTTTDVNCFQGTNGSITINAIGGTAPLNYDWIPTGETTPTIQNLAAGSYSCNVSDSPGCTTVFSTTITQNPPLVAPISVTQMSVMGANDGSMFVTVSGGTGLGTYTYNWVDANTNTVGGNSPSINSLPVGTYTCTVTDLNGCILEVAGVIDPLSCSVTVVDNISTITCFGGTATVSWENTGGLAPYTNTLIDPNGDPVDLFAIYGTNQFDNNLPTPLNLTAGIYQLTVTDANGCHGNSSAAIHLNVLEPAELEFSSLTTTDVLCYGDPTGTVNATVIGGTFAVLPTWTVTPSTPPSVAVNPGALYTGNYVVTAIDDNGCMIDAPFTINEPVAPLTLLASSTFEGCMPNTNGTATVTPAGGTPDLSGNYFYNWNPQNTQTISSLVAGTYTCIVTDDNGCTATISENVLNAPALSVTITATNPTCEGSNDGSIITSTTASGPSLPVNYVWENNLTPGFQISANASMNSLDEGNYTLVPTDAFGCTQTIPAIQLTDPAAITYTLTVTNPTLNGACDGSIAVTNTVGGDGNYSFEWIGPGGYITTPLAPGDIFSLCEGQYQLTVTDGMGCTGVQNIQVIDPACNITVTPLLTQPACAGGVGTLTWNISGGIAPYYTIVEEYGTGIIQYSGFVTPPTVPVNLPDGNYFMTVYDNMGTGCPAQIQNITVTEPFPLTPTVLTDSVDCNGFSTGQATAVVVGGTPPYVNYSWSSSLTNNSPVNSSQTAGPSTLVVTDANGCNSATINYTIYEPNPLIISTPMIFAEPTCNSGGDAEVMATITGGTAPYTYLWSPSGDNTNPATGLAPSIGIFAGLQTLLVEDVNGCLVSDNIIITDPAPITAVFTSNDVVCYNGNNGSITITPSGGTGNYSYQWSPGGATTQFITGLTAGTYTCIVTDATGVCSNTFSETITQGNQIIPNLTITDADCFGVNNGAATVSPSGGSGNLNTLWWDPSITTNSAINLFQGTGVYWVQITDNNNPTCDILVPFDIDEPAIITASATSQATSCNAGSDGQITVIASGGTAPYTYTLYDLSNPTLVVGVNGTGIFPGLTAGTYTCDIDDGFCPVQTSIVTATVLEPSLIVLNETITPITCFGGNDGIATVAPTGENDNFTISWSHFLPAGPTATGLSGLLYTVYVTPTNGCGVQAFNIDMALYESSLIDLTNITPSFYDYDLDGVGTEVECYGNSDGSVVLIPSGGNSISYTYLWDDDAGQTVSNPVGLIAGTYNVDVTDASGCVASTSIILTEPAEILPTFTPTNVSCSGLTDGSIALSTPIGGITATNFQYFLNSTNYGNILNINMLPPNTYTVEVLNTMTGCSSGIQSINIIDPAPLTAVAGSTAVSCNGLSDGTATLISTGGTSPFTYSWENDLIPGVVVSTNDIASGLTAGSYTCTITDAMFCTTTATANVNEPIIISPNLTYVDVTCNGLSDGAVTATPTGGNSGPYTYSWSNDPLNTLNTSSGLAAVSTPYPTLIVYDIDDCPSTAENIIITEPAVFTISASVSSNYNGADISCYGFSDGEITITPLGGVGGEQYDLGLGAGSTATSTITSLSAATYFIDGYDANGCFANTSVTITSPSALNTDLTIQNVSCLGANDGIISFPNTTGGTPDLTGNYNYTWNVPSVPTTFSASTTSGTYPLSPFALGYVTVSDDNGCDVIESVSITEPTAISASTSFTEPICNGDATATVTIVASGGTSPFTYSWVDSASNGIILSTNDMLTGVTAGTYICTYTDANGCSADITEVITEPAALDAGLVVTPISCLGLNDGIAEVFPTGSVGPYTISWSDSIGNTSNTNTGLGPFDATNIITVTVTDGIGCGSVTNTVVVLTPTSPLTVHLANTIEPTCNGDANGQFEMSATGGTSPYYYEWPQYGGVPTTNVYSPAVNAAIWTCILTDANGCADTIDLTMTEPTSIVPNITTITSYNGFDVECNGGSNGAIIATPSGGTVVIPSTDYTYLWSNGPTLDVNTLLSGTTYDVTVTDLNGCTGTESITLTEPPAVTFSFVTSNFNGYEVSCNGSNDGTISVTFSGGANGEDMTTFDWTSPVVTNPSSPSIANLSADTYVCEVADMNGCLYSDNITLNEPTPIFLTETSTPTTCNGDVDGEATVTATGGVIINSYSYDWGALAANQNNATADNLAGSTTGVTYNVIVTDDNGCTANINSTIYSPDLIVTTFATQVNVTCYGGSDGYLENISTTGGNGTLYNYSTDSGATFTPALPIYNGLAEGTFSIIAQDNLGCLATSNVTITEPNEIDPNLNQQTSVTCNGVNDGEIIATPTGGNSPYAYQWSNGVSGVNDVIDNLSAGTYTVIVTDGNGCLGLDTVTLFPSNNLEIIFDISNATVSCNGGSDGIVVAALNGGGLAISWLWNDPSFQTVPTASALAAGWYTCIITDANGCVVTDSVEVIEPATNLEIVANSSDLKCYNNDSGTANVVVTSPGQGSPSYVWNTIPVTSVISTANSISSLSVGTYQVAVTDAGGCIQYDTVIVDQPDSLYAILTGNDISCNGLADGSISINTFGGTIPYIHTWQGPGGYTTVNTNITALEEGLYDLLIEDSNGCNFIDNININEPEVIDVIPTVSNNNGFGLSCFESSDGEITAIISGGIAPFVVQYGSLFPTTQIADTFVTFSSLPGSVEDLTITDANGCEHITNISITQPNLLEIVSYVVTNPTCYGINDGSATINVTGGVAPYSFVDANLSPFDTSSIGAGSPTVFAYDLNGCSAFVNLIIEEPSEIEISNVQCLNSISIEVQNALGDFEIIWTDESGSFIGSDLEINDLTSQMYTVKILDQPYGCMQTDSFSIELPVFDVIDASCSSNSDGSIEITDLGTSFYDIFINEVLVAEDVITSFNDGLEVGEYAISIVDEGNCVYNTTAFVGYVGGIECVDPQIIISPNYDGSNDTWKPTIDVNVDIYVTIYNRWGEVEFFTETNSLTFEWDGTTTNGEHLPSTDYYFVIEFIEQDSMLDKTGVITLIR